MRRLWSNHKSQSLGPTFVKTSSHTLVFFTWVQGINVGRPFWTLGLSDALLMYFEISPPMNEDDANPAVRQYFLSFCLLAKDDRQYIENDDWWMDCKLNLLLYAVYRSLQSNHSSADRLCRSRGSKSISACSNSKGRAMLFRNQPSVYISGDDSHARSFVTCVGCISGNMTERRCLKWTFTRFRP